MKKLLLGDGEEVSLSRQWLYVDELGLSGRGRHWCEELLPDDKRVGKQKHYLAFWLQYICVDVLPWKEISERLAIYVKFVDAAQTQTLTL